MELLLTSRLGCPLTRGEQKSLSGRLMTGTCHERTLDRVGSKTAIRP